MPRYETPEVSFDAPNDWEDKTVVAFSAPPKPGAIVPNVVLTKDKLKAGETLQAYSDRTVVDMVKNLAGFKLIEKEERAIGEVVGVEIKFSWKGSSGKAILQHMVIAQSGGPNVVGLNVTCDLADAKKVEPIAQRILASFKVTPQR